MSGLNAPTVSCLCVTEGRSAFMPWLLWCYDRQSWPRRELVIVDSSHQPLHVPNRGDVRVVTAPRGGLPASVTSPSGRHRARSSPGLTTTIGSIRTNWPGWSRP